MSPKAFKVLQQLSAAEKAAQAGGDADPSDIDETEIAVCGRTAMIGTQRIPKKVVDELLWAMAIKGDEIGDTTYYHINCTGEAILRRPELEAEILTAVLKGRGAWQIVDDRIVLMPRDGAPA